MSEGGGRGVLCCPRQRRAQRKRGPCVLPSDPSSAVMSEPDLRVCCRCCARASQTLSTATPSTFPTRTPKVGPPLFTLPHALTLGPSHWDPAHAASKRQARSLGQTTNNKQNFPCRYARRRLTMRPSLERCRRRWRPSLWPFPSPFSAESVPSGQPQ